ncbi:MAG: hypothetical protein J6N72_07905 [Psychrobacter sp.]|nr:hypothetical protein [Psychrobacter sp.]
MVDAVNQCLLSQTDFDFMTKANLVTELTNSLSYEISNSSATLFACTLTGIAALLLIVFAFIVRGTHKKYSNILLIIAIAVISCLVAMVYSASTSVKEVNSQLREAKSELTTLEKPDVEIFDACHRPDAILKLAPNRDDPEFKSTYSKIVSVE